MLIYSDKLVLATQNKDKVVEIQHVLNGLNLNIVSASELDNLPEVDEDGETIEINAIMKARFVSKATGLLALADDTALEVDFLGGKPGVYSSRFAGQGASYADNVKLLLERLAGVPREQRTARFRCVMALAKDRDILTVEGCCEGVILQEPRGENGFGYDPIFYIPEYNQTFAEMSIELKNQISHRGKALRKVRAILAS